MAGTMIGLGKKKKNWLLAQKQLTALITDLKVYLERFCDDANPLGFSVLVGDK